LLSLAPLKDLSITVYIPADSIGKISLGQAAAISVDAYPGETFHAAVVNISTQPIFLPRTTHTISTDKSTVYAIRLELKDAAGKLKPGMPADTIFDIR
jgi:HlyD family secretion protein